MNSVQVFFILFALGISIAQDFHGPTYEQEQGILKASQLYQASLNDTTSGRWYSFEELELLFESMNLSFSYFGDDMPYQFASLLRRMKLIHSVGVVGRGSWVPSNSPFTGVLGSGCKNLIIRLSLARQADDSTPYTPGLSLKCLRNGVSSGNIFAMYSLNGQPNSWNFFKHDLTNHVPDLGKSASFALTSLRKKFSEASDYPVMIGLSDLARYSEDGTEFSTPHFPFRLVFHPVSNWHNYFPDEQPSSTFQEQLENALVPGPLYEIYAQVEPTVDNLILIGQLRLTTPTSTSLFGDTIMFFQHTHMEDDLHYRPDWVGPAKNIMAEQQAQDNYVFPDLPW